jgi:Uma2 family endonuclease
LIKPLSLAPAAVEDLGELLDRLGNIPPGRIRLRPPLGTATEEDVLNVHAREKRLCELIDGVLVEKAMGFRESCLAVALIRCLKAFVAPRKLGLVTGEAGMMRLASGLVRIPDVAFISWDRIPGRRMPTEAIPSLAPDLAVEVLSASNTAGEIARKLREYFEAGVSLVWLVDPAVRTVTVFLGPEQSTVLKEADTVNGGEVLPEFSLALRDLFAELDQKGDE